MFSRPLTGAFPLEARLANTRVYEWSTTAASNTDINSNNIAEGCAPSGINNAIRELMRQVRIEVANQGSDIASAGTTDIGAATGQYVKVTGTTTITALGTVNAGTMRWVEFTGVLTLTHNATSLKLPGSANITTAAGDVAFFVSLGSGNWKCLGFWPVSGGTVAVASTTVKGAVEYATDAEFLGASASAVVLTPSNLAARPSFRAHKNGSAQGSIGAAGVNITFGTERWDTGGYFASNGWTPPSGKIVLIVSLNWDSTNAVANEILTTTLVKAGSADSGVQHIRSGTGSATFIDTFIVDANGTDEFHIQASKSGAGNGQIDGTATATWFAGYML